MKPNTLITATGIAGGAALLAPVAAPALHGIAGIAVVGLGLYASGTAVMNAAGMINDKATELFAAGGVPIELLKGTLFSKPVKKAPVKEIPFTRQKTVA